MNRFLTVASSALVASGLAILPVASFAQAGGDAAKTPTQTAPAGAATATTAPAGAMTASTPVKTPVVTQDKARSVKSAPVTTAKSDAKAPVTGKSGKHVAKAPVHHHVAKAPVKDTIVKG